jgi:transposase
VVDGDGAGVWRGKCAAEPETIAALLAVKAPGLARVTLETGALSGWLYRELRRREVPVVCVDARHAKAVLMQRLNKTDAIDAQGLAELARVGPRPAASAVPSGMDRRPLAADGSRRCSPRASRRSWWQP